MADRWERRTQTGTVERRADSGDRAVIGGYAIVWDRRSSNLGGFVEIVKPSATSKTVREADIRALKNHDPNLVVGRSRGDRPTLVLREDSIGLDYSIHLPDTSTARDLLEEVQGGLITGSSFGFRTIRDSWGETEEGFPERALEEIALRDVGPVTFPAYPDATAGKRALELTAETRSLDLGAVLAAAGDGHLLDIIAGRAETAAGDTIPSEPTTADEGTTRRDHPTGRRLRRSGLI